MSNLNPVSGGHMRFISKRMLAIGFGISLSSGLSAAEPVEQIVRQLAHERYIVREKAAQQLVKMGESALAPLRSGLKSQDEETRQRAEVLIAQIEHQVRSRKMLESPKIRLQFNNKPIKDAIADVNRITRLNLQLPSGPESDLNRRITLDTDEVPFWEAVEIFLKEAHLVEDTSSTVQPTPNQDGARNIILNGPPSTYSVPNVPNQPHLLQFSHFTKSVSVDAERGLRVKALSVKKSNPSTGDITLNLRVDAHPGLAVTELIGADVKVAKTSDGRLLEISRVTNPFRSIDQQVQILIQQQARLNVINEIVMPDNGSNSIIPITIKSGGLQIKELEEIHGTISARVVAPKDTLFTIDRVKESAGQQINAGDGLRVSFKEATTRLNSTAVVRLTVYLDPSTQQFMNLNVPFKGRARPFLQIQRGYPQSPSQTPDFYLVLPTGEYRKAVSVSATGIEMTEDGAKYDLELTFDKPEKWTGIGLVAKGRRVVNVEMPFTLKGVTMMEK